MDFSWLLPEAVSQQGDDLRGLWITFLIAAAVVGIFVYVLLTYTLIRFRRRDDKLPKQVYYRTWVEVSYTIVPLLIVGWLIALTIPAVADTEKVTTDPDVVVEVVGYQWAWQMTYPDSGIVVNTPEDELVLPARSTIRFELSSTDVIHSFWVPGFYFKRDAIPGRVQTFDITTDDELGTFPAVCAEYCGLDHAEMRFDVRIVSAEEFDAWVSDTGNEKAGS